MLSVVVMGDRTIEDFHLSMEVRSPLSYCPRSSLPVEGPHLAGRPPRRRAVATTARGRWQPTLPLEVRLDVVAAVLLDGLSYRRAGRMVGISMTEVGDSMDLLLAARGYCQPDGTFITTLADLGGLLVELAQTGEGVVVDRLATWVQ